MRPSAACPPWHDVVDWAGGFPFEVAKPEQVFAFYEQRGFSLKGLKTCGGGKGCNEFLLIKGQQEPCPVPQSGAERAPGFQIPEDVNV